MKELIKNNMYNVGIDKIGLYVPNFYLKLTDLALYRNIDPNKFTIKLGQKEMAIAPPDEDIVTMAAAAVNNLNLESFSDIDWLILSTECGIDQSKSAALYVQRLLKMPSNIRAIEMKQACYASTAAIQLAVTYICNNPSKKIIIVSSDISRYGFSTAGESSQGAAAIALLISANPKILSISKFFGNHTEEIMDFWCPNYKREAIVVGKLSCETYLNFLEKSYKNYIKHGGEKNLYAYCFHAPFPKLVEKAYDRFKIPNKQLQLLQNSLLYSRIIGNCYTASLYLSLISLLCNTDEDLGEKNIGMYAYGSGSVSEFFNIKLTKRYKEFLQTQNYANMLKSRKLSSIIEYEKFYKFKLPEDGSDFIIPNFSSNRYRLAGISNHKRLYRDMK